jgi:Methyltransferase domain
MAMPLPRRLQPELLDVLPADDPAALRSRRDLRLLNRVMLHPRIMAWQMRRHAAERPRKIVELGAGDGSMMLRLARRLARRWPNVETVLVDRQDIVRPATRQALAALSWQSEPVAQDVFDYLDLAEPADIVIANLFLHHFTAAQLSELFRQSFELAPLFVALEPRRSALPLAGSRAIWLLGCNHVSRHDAVASVHAGFRGRELSALWPGGHGWTLLEGKAGPWTHAFVAKKC